MADDWFKQNAPGSDWFAQNAPPPVRGMELLGGQPPGPAKVPKIPRYITTPRLKQDSSEDLSNDDSIMGTITKDVAGTVRGFPDAAFRAARILHPAAAMASGYNPVNDLKDVAGAASSIPQELDSDLIHGRWGKVTARAIEAALPYLNEGQLIGVQNAVEAVPGAVSTGGRALKGAVRGGYEASKTPAVRIPASIGVGTGELVGGPRGAAMGGFIGAAPGVLRGMWRGAKPELFPKSLPFADTPATGVDIGDLPFGSGTPVYPPLRIATHPANYPPVPAGETATVPPSGGRAPVVPPIRSASGTVVPAPEPTFTGTVLFEKANVPDVPGSGTPVRPPWTQRELSPENQAVVDRIKRELGLPGKLTAPPAETPPPAPTPVASVLPAPPAVPVPSAAAPPSDGGKLYSTTKNPHTELTSQIHAMGREMDLEGSPPGKKVHVNPVAQELHGADWKDLTLDQKAAITEFLNRNKRFPKATDIQSGLYR